MSCPYAPPVHRDATNGITLQPIEEKFRSCLAFRVALQSCRERVSREGKGHCLEISEKVGSCRKIRKEQEKSLVATCGKISLIRSLFDVCSDEGLSQSDWKKCQDRFDKYEKCESKHLLEK